ncbi:MAG: hypothetical protein GF308_01295 [Candidatus Heimdallarchaeota archaeon]|nr:hypothetical protein [Candidatus Heimdallarchaeota archaeon]
MGWFNKKECKKYVPGLSYLGSKGFEVRFESDGKILNSKEHQKEFLSAFGLPKGNLSRPYEFEWGTLAKEFMEHYKIETIVDIAKYMRIISIILSNFKGPAEKDLFLNHQKRLIKIFEYQYGFNPLIVREALIAYDEVFSTRKALPEKEYTTFATVLDYFFYLFKADHSLHNYEDEFF